MRPLCALALIAAACVSAPQPSLRAAAPDVVERLATARRLAARARVPHFVTFDEGRIRILADSNADGALDDGDIAVEDDAMLPDDVTFERSPAWIRFHPTGSVTYPEGYADPGRPDLILVSGRNRIQFHIHEPTGQVERD